MLYNCAACGGAPERGTTCGGKCKRTVHCQRGGVMCYTKEGKDSKAYSFGFENLRVTGMGGFRLIACVRENEKLRHGCN